MSWRNPGKKQAKKNAVTSDNNHPYIEQQGGWINGNETGPHFDPIIVYH
jgi:hypothetical protein